ncbi:MAG: hypothetical protein A2Z04_07270 [Chloroflexi bacterium RBG_16_57_9]|nr:MAG: hypothetical protein A2Z04_07270 [Chloroflexi bacterium RBG_16_57_9]
MTWAPLSEKGYAVMVENEDGEPVEQTYFGRDFEKNFFSDETNRVFCETFLKHTQRDPLIRRSRRPTSALSARGARQLQST